MGQTFNAPLIKELRESRSWTLEDVAKKMKVSPQSIFYWETGKKTPRKPKIALLARIYRIAKEKLFIDISENSHHE